MVLYSLTRFKYVALALLIGGVVLRQGYLCWKALDRPFEGLTSPIILEIAPGTSLQQCVHLMAALGLTSDPWFLKYYARFQGLEKSLRAGDYAVLEGMTLRELIAHIRAGKELQYALTIIPGWREEEVLELVRRHEKLLHSPQSIEKVAGPFLPDTYFFTAYSSEKAFLERARKAFQKTVQAVWAARSPMVMLTTPEELVVLASIIEKETSIEAERPHVSGVFHKRLAMGIRLQADPTVRYAFSLAQGESLLKKHLQNDHPYNTYTRRGLPPGPIALPSRASLEAAARPEITGALYFVAKGDGSHVFSKTLQEHNRAVQAYRAQK